MDIIVDYPPLFDQIDAAFNVRGKDVIFSWGARIYNPQNLPITPALLAHEAVHGLRQGRHENTIRDWWLRYIDSPRFRLAEEIPAHQAEYRWLLEFAGRTERRKALHHVAGKLAGPLYGRMVTKSRAKAILREDW